MNPKEMVMHSGGAAGADTHWDHFAKAYGIEDRRHYYYGKKTPLGNCCISEDELEEGFQKVLIGNLILKRHSLIKYKDLLGRNGTIAQKSEAIFAIATIERDTISGGTAHGCVCAVLAGKPVYLFDQNIEKWFLVSKHETLEQLVFKSSFFVPTLTTHFGAIGTRDLNTKGIDAIRSVFFKSFPLISLEVKESE